MSAITADLSTHAFTQGFWPDHIARLRNMASEVTFRPGEMIFHEGDHSSFFYLVVTGKVALEVISPGRPVRVHTLYPGDLLGWSSVTGDGDSKQFQARALENVRALAFDGARLRHACEEDYAFGFHFMRAILSVMSERLHAIRTQLVDLYTPVGCGK